MEVIPAELVGHRVIVSYGVCNVIAGKFLEQHSSTAGVPWVVIGTTKSDIRHPVRQADITKFCHAKLECAECKA